MLCTKGESPEVSDEMDRMWAPLCEQLLWSLLWLSTNHVIKPRLNSLTLDVEYIYQYRLVLLLWLLLANNEPWKCLTLNPVLFGFQEQFPSSIYWLSFYRVHYSYSSEVLVCWALTLPHFKEDSRVSWIPKEKGQLDDTSRVCTCKTFNTPGSPNTVLSHHHNCV